MRDNRKAAATLAGQENSSDDSFLRVESVTSSVMPQASNSFSSWVRAPSSFHVAVGLDDGQQVVGRLLPLALRVLDHGEVETRLDDPSDSLQAAARIRPDRQGWRPVPRARSSSARLRSPRPPACRAACGQAPPPRLRRRRPRTAGRPARLSPRHCQAFPAARHRRCRPRSGDRRHRAPVWPQPAPRRPAGLPPFLPTSFWMKSRIWLSGMAPMKPSTGWPFLKAMTAGMDWMPSWPAIAGCSSMFILTSLTRPPAAATTFSSAGCELLAGTAPGRPEIDQHRLLARFLDHVGREGRGRHVLDRRRRSCGAVGAAQPSGEP